MTDEKPSLTKEQEAEIKLRVQTIDAFCTNLRNNMCHRAISGYLKDGRSLNTVIENPQKEADEEFVDMLVYLSYAALKKEVKAP